MAINKRKILQSAQKHLQKGALDRALKDYQTLLAADPQDTNIRLKIGDLQLRRGKTAEAAEAYLKVASQFMKDGFDAKAVAIYKQVSRIDPRRGEVYEPLAELYQRMGLTSEAMNALQSAADAHYRQGRKREALQLLQRMASLDPTNTTSRLKVAELLRQGHMHEEAAAEYREIADECERQQDSDGLMSALEKLLELKPSEIEVLTRIARLHIEKDRPGLAELAAQRIVEVAPDAPRGYELLAEACRAGGREAKLDEVYRSLAEAYRKSGQEDKARDILQRFVSAQPMAQERSDPGVDMTFGEDELAGDADEDLGGGGLEIPLEIEADDAGAATTLLSTERAGVSEVAAEEAPPSASTQMAPAAEPVSDLLPESDPDQLLAEASVYLRYGKHEHAIGSLQALLEQEPDHRTALEKLGEAYTAAGQAQNAVAAFARAAEQARRLGDATGLDVLKGRVAALDPAAAASIGSLDSEGADEAKPEPEGMELVEFEIEGEESVPEPGDFAVDAVPTPRSGPGDAGHGPMPAPMEPADSAEEVGPEPELAAEPDVAPEIEVASEPELAPEPEFPPESEVAPEFEVAPKAERVPALEAAPEPAAAPQSERPAAAEDSGVLPGGAHEDLEEAEFYFQQGMHEEAETLYRRILATAPNHPQAQLRLGELASRRKSGGRGLGPDDDAALDVVVPAAAEAPGTPRSRPRPSQDDDLGMELPDDLVDPFAGLEDEELPAPQETVAAPAPAAGGEATEAGDDLFGLVEVEDAPAAAPESDPAEHRTRVRPAPFQAETTARDGELPGALFAEPLADAASEEASSGEKASGFDLAAALSDAFESHEGDAGTAGATTEEEGFQEVFQAFKRGVSETLGEGDGEARYDLGIAYREMGLLEDAVAEFRSAAAEPSRRLESLHMLSVCMLDLGDARGALTHLEEALDHPGLEEIQQASLRFELGRVYEALEEPAEALDAYRAVAQVEPDFQDLAQRLATLEGSGTVSPAPEPSLESFEDLVVDGEADAEKAESEPAGVADASGTRQPVPDAEAEAPEPAQAETIGEYRPPAPEMPMADAPVPETLPETSVPPAEAAAEVPSEPEAPEPPETEGPVEPAAPGDEDPGTEPPKRSARTRRKKISFF